MFQVSNNSHGRGGIALTSLSVAVGALMLSACTPPLPPDVLAAQIENQITCQVGDQQVSVPSEFAFSMDTVNQTLMGVCADQSVSEVDSTTPASVTITSAAPTAEELTRLEETCTGDLITVPVFAYGVTLAYNILGLDGLIISPEVAAGILSGSITAWDDPAISELNTDYDLTGLPPITVMSEEAGTGAVNAMTTWMSTLAPEAWSEGVTDTLNYGDKYASTQELIDNLISIEGTVAVLPISLASANVIPMAATEVNGQIINPEDTQLQKVGAGALTITSDPDAGSLTTSPATGGVPVEGNFDLAASKVVIPEGQQLVGWPIMGIAHATVCNDPGHPLPLSTVQFMVRLSGQGSFESYGLTPLPEPIRVQTFSPLLVSLQLDGATTDAIGSDE